MMKRGERRDRGKRRDKGKDRRQRLNGKGKGKIRSVGKRNRNDNQLEHNACMLAPALVLINIT